MAPLGRFEVYTILFIFAEPAAIAAMTFEYAWLKVLETLARRGHGMPLNHLKEELRRVGFFMDDASLEEAMRRLRKEELVDTLVLAGGEVQEVSITPKGERKVRGIVRF